MTLVTDELKFERPFLQNPILLMLLLHTWKKVLPRIHSLKSSLCIFVIAGSIGNFLKVLSRLSYDFLFFTLVILLHFVFLVFSHYCIFHFVVIWCDLRDSHHCLYLSCTKGSLLFSTSAKHSYIQEVADGDEVLLV